WALAKDESKLDRLSTVLYNLAESIIVGSSLLQPFMPTATEKILAQFGVTAREFCDIEKFGLLKDGTKVTDKPEIVFARLDGKEISAKISAIYDERRAKFEKENGAASVDAKLDTAKDGKQADTKTDGKSIEIKTDGKAVDKTENANNAENVVDINQIDIEQFAKVQLKVGEILTAEKVEKADKLLKFTVKIGEETRTIVSGIAKFYTPEEMVGKLVVVVANLKSAKLRGIESQGMLLCACDGDDVVLVSPEKKVNSGSQVR
ncbi:MAG: methionine--tRNA ligase subunit beta, partial [Clostridia bacterium]